MSSSASLGERGQDVPARDGDPSTFASFETACRWYVLTLKESEKPGAAARIWGRLSGPAKSVVKHLDPEFFHNNRGWELLLDKLRKSPLQTLPIPDSFQKLEKWSNLRRRDRESIPEFLVREEENFAELQQSLKRSREISKPTLSATTLQAPAGPTEDGSAEPPEKDATDEPEDFEDLRDFKKASPSSSPTRAQRPPRSPTARSPETVTAAQDFSVELRGYRLLKGAGLTVPERQQVLTLANNNVNFDIIRQALRAFADDSLEGRRHRQRDHHAWWTGEEDSYDEVSSAAFDGEAFEDSDGMFWGEAGWEPAGWDAGAWEDWPEEAAFYEDYGYNEDCVEEAFYEEEATPTAEEAETLRQESEAVALAAEANRTLQEARAAVAKVRAARGYYPLGGKGTAPKGKKGGPLKCLLCGQPGHFFRDCPQRFKGAVHYQKGFPKGGLGYKAAGKGKSKGKPTGKGKGHSAFYHRIYAMEVVNELPATIQSELPATSQNELPAMIQNELPAAIQDELPAMIQNELPATIQDELPAVIQEDVIQDGTLSFLPRMWHLLRRVSGYLLQGFPGTAVGEVPVTPPRTGQCDEHLALAMQTIGVMHTGPPALQEADPPPFVLDTGATENAAGVRTLQRLLRTGGTLRNVSLQDRPVFRFGDGLALRAASRVDLTNTALGSISFYVLDGDARTSTRHSEDTPLLVGSRFLHDRKACISYEHQTMFLKAPTGEIYSAALDRTRTGHLVLDSYASPTDLTALKERAEERYGVQLPDDSVRLLELFSSPGAIRALSGNQETGGSDAFSLASGRKQGLRNEPFSEFSQKGKTCCTTCFRAGRAAASESDCGERVHPPDPQEPSRDLCCEILALSSRDRLVPPLLSHKIKALQLRLCALQLRASPLHGEDAGALERPPGERMAVQGAPPGREEPREPVRPVDRLHPLRPSSILCGDQGSRRAQDSRADDRGDHLRHEGARGDVPRRHHRDDQRDRGQGQDHGGAKPQLHGWSADSLEEDHGLRQEGDHPGAGAHLRCPPGNDSEGCTADAEPGHWTGTLREPDRDHRGPQQQGRRDQDDQGGDQEASRQPRGPRLPARGSDPADHVPGKQADGTARESSRGEGRRLAAKLGRHERDAGCSSGGRRGTQHGAVKVDGGGHPGTTSRQSMCSFGASGPDLEGLPTRQGVTTTCRKRMLTESRGFLARALCIATSLLTLTSNSLDVFEIGRDILSPAFREEGLVCETATVAQGFHLDNPKDVENILNKVRATDPKMLWVSLPDHRLMRTTCSGPPGQQRNYERARRRDLYAAELVSEVVSERLGSGRRFAWMWRAEAHWGWRSRAVEKIKEAVGECGCDLFECVVDQCCYERGGLGSPNRWKILTDAKQLYYKMGRKSCPGHREHGDWELKVMGLPENMILDITGAVCWELQLQHGSLREDVEAFMVADQNYDTTANQNYDTTADQNYNTTADQNYDTQRTRTTTPQRTRTTTPQRTRTTTPQWTRTMTPLLATRPRVTCTRFSA